MMYTHVIYCAFLTHISLLFVFYQSKKKDYIICRILNGKEGIYVTGLLSRLTIKSMFFCRSTLENMQLYMKLHFWILFKDRVSIFFRVSIVSILLSMEFEWT